MHDPNIFQNISPLDHRYYQANKKLFTKLREYLSEEAMVKYCTKVEAALVKGHLKRLGKENEDDLLVLDRLPELINPQDVYKEEEKTKHNIRALVNSLQPLLPEHLQAFVHMGTTSVDILDTANALRVRDVTQELIIPQLKKLALELASFVDAQAGTAQVGRTHGQYAVPVTLGFSLAEYLSRLGKSIQRIEELSKDLRGKIAGAVGAYNATSMISADPIEFESFILEQLGLRASDHSTQLVEPEHLLRVLLEMNVAFGILANLADDLRNLQRSEIDELREYFASTQVGSSTMPQKRNPWNSEHVKSLWKAFAPRVMTFYMDQISEHQRDLSNSASGRFITDYIAGFSAAIARMESIISKLAVNEEGLRRNLERAGSSLLAEPAYILLATMGESEAHEVIRRVTLLGEERKISFADALQEDENVWSKIEQGLKKVGIQNAKDFFAHPQNYRGRAYEKAKEISSYWIAQFS